MEEFEFHYKDHENKPMDYFKKDPYSNQIPAVDEVRDWPLEAEVFSVDYTYRPSTTIMFQPKETFHTITNRDYYVSPRKFYRYQTNKGRNFICCEKFIIETLFTITQHDTDPTEPDYDPLHPYKLEIFMETRCKVLEDFWAAAILEYQFLLQGKGHRDKYFEPDFE